MNYDYETVNDKFYSQDHWGLDRSENKWFAKFAKVKILKKFMKEVNRGVLYDAGGGVGNYGWFFGRDFEETIVSDISQIALDRIPEKNIKRLHCSVLDNDLPDNSVDCILLVDVFEHIEEKDLLAMMKDLRRILKPNGRILIYTGYHGFGFGECIKRIFNPKKRLTDYEKRGGHINKLNYGEYQSLFKESNLKIEDRYFYSVIFQPLTDSLKDHLSVWVSKILHRKNKDIGRTGQSIKEDVRKKETKLIYKIPLLLLSYISYLDILIFGKWFPGNSIFLSLSKGALPSEDGE